MVVIDRLALYENAIVRMKHRKGLALQKKENQVGFSCRMLAVVVCDFRSPNNCLDATPVEPRHLCGAQQPVFDDPVKLSCNLVLLCSGKGKS